MQSRQELHVFAQLNKLTVLVTQVFILSSHNLL